MANGRSARAPAGNTSKHISNRDQGNPQREQGEYRTSN